ncbi:hypothetical protein E2562_000405 [Oryza meyeriana var. granulata]|uniref:Anthocyanin 5-aromatic acyltransferase n=1 Tax=Oryza meyeriana var. granulata TaxID=110450 RepID=A0A6G1CCF1_9ORYZ|nr:hypothetical protein E2562_000405 [Oryza meyeriana var. granulata]
MAPPSVTIIEEGRITVPPAAALSEPALFKLSPLDAQWITLPLIQRVLVFDAGAGAAIPPFESVVASLRASLAETVARLLPLARRIVFLPSSGEAAIDCSEGGVAGGVRFVVAECGDADAARVAGDADHDVGLMERLVPVLDADALPAETMAAQVTRLGGGVAVGVALHHAVVDGRSVWRFFEAWAAACRGGDAWSAAPGLMFDRAAVALPGGEELARTVLRVHAPNLPVATVPKFLVEDRLKLSRRTFTVASAQIHRLKQRIAGALMASPLPSSFVALSALAWVSFVRSKNSAGAIAADDEVYLFFFIDCRGRRAAFDPPVEDNFFGTCISGCLAVATARDLLSDDGLVTAAAAVQGEVRRAAEDPLAGWDWMSLLSRISLHRLVNMAGSTRLPAYEAADFGWGPPSRTELVTMNHDGQVVLVAAKCGGGVQASVSLHPAHMDAFKSHFESY